MAKTARQKPAIEKPIRPKVSIDISDSMPRATPLNRQGMRPERLLKVVQQISPAVLDSMEQTIQQGCGRIESHGQ